MATRQQRRPGVDARVLVGLVLLALGLLQILSMLSARLEQGSYEHALSIVGYYLSHPFINFGLGFFWTLVLPAIILQTGWAMLRSLPVSQRVPRFSRQLLFACAGALTHALVRVRAFDQGTLDGAWEAGSAAVLSVNWLMRVAHLPGAIIVILTLDLIVLAIVFHLHPGVLLVRPVEAMQNVIHVIRARLTEGLRRLYQLRARRRQEHEKRKRDTAKAAREQAKSERDAERVRKAEEEQARAEEREALRAAMLKREQEQERAGEEEEQGALPLDDSYDDSGTVSQSEQGTEEDEFDVSDEIIEQEQHFRVKRARGPYKYVPPSVDLLDDPPTDEYHVTDEDIQLASQQLVSCLKDFNVEARVVHVHPGPVITRYDLEPAPGVKVSRIAGLADDLALALRAERIRIIAPVPGKGAVGIELPNSKRNMVFMKSIVNTEKFSRAASPLTIALGKTSSGEAAVADLRSMPHILIAGQTGAGKSVCINSFICSILLRALPTEVQFVLIDPKMIELSDYARVAHHFLAGISGIEGPVVTSPQDAVRVLEAIEIEMDLRYRALSRTGYRSITEFNDALESGEVALRLKEGDIRFDHLPEGEIPERMVYLVVIIDELADLMMTAGKEIETSIARLAQKARAVGIHLVVATQRPSVDVLTGLIKANFPARIAFAVRQKVDSKTIIDAMGADQLLGKGDMLYLASGSPEPQRMHNCFISGKEIRRLMDHIRKQSRDFEKFKLPMRESEDTSGPGGFDTGERDELFHDAAEIVIRSRQGSVSVLQRRLRVGHSRASRLIDELEIAGVVGPFDGSKAREVLVDESWLDENR